MQMRATIHRPLPTYGLAVSGTRAPSAVRISKIQNNISNTTILPFVVGHPPRLLLQIWLSKSIHASGVAIHLGRNDSKL